MSGSPAAGPIAVVGGGSWGTALANAAALAGHDVNLWLRDASAAGEMASTRQNEAYLPGVVLHARVRPTGDVVELAEAAAVLMAVPAQVLRGVVEALAPALPRLAPLVLCAKGIERSSAAFLSDVVAEVRPASPVAVLSGPSFAADVARGMPTAVTLACGDARLAETWATALSSQNFRVYHGSDVRGVEIGGAAKNVLAIACGVVAGRGLGESARAALVARGFAELLRFARAFGGRPETLMGLSGLGDLVLTASSPQSRNFAFGQRLGQGIAVAEAAGGKLAEGAFTAGALIQRAGTKGIDMPVSEAVAAVVDGEWTVEEAIDALLSRPLRGEEDA